ncbi:hypothetical protein M501DRAFT_1022486 [Patellaria atrata CBS 101060]|uniref:FAM192A/Fyv6 N-terminal domain-containing protein n=1 Tax=Patellaria atrata CBS 101060 TaxID=1346257 RepID=A0A9P4SHC3_9PEZI|nr:hypothetical protein M501DRAFT_1022486 [Patellaria atrata CBS 101060]
MSKFVAAGTNENPIERDEAWLKAQQEIEENRRRKEDQNQAQGSKSLFEILQANKAAKQEAFEESIKLKHQFRSLDADEIDFLDAVHESTRAKEAAIKKETTEQLNLFRKQQEEVERAATVAEDDSKHSNEGEKWEARRKRKRERERILGGVKLRRKESSVTDDNKEEGSNAVSPPLKSTQTRQKRNANGSTPSPPEAQATSIQGENKMTGKHSTELASSPFSSPKPPTTRGALLGLTNYSSEDDD